MLLEARRLCALLVQNCVLYILYTSTHQQHARYELQCDEIPRVIWFAEKSWPGVERPVQQNSLFSPELVPNVFVPV